MAEKKTTQKVLSERALELVMLNVLGGDMGMLSQPQDMDQGCNKTSSGEDKSKQQGVTQSTGPDSAKLNGQKTDQELNS